MTDNATVVREDLRNTGGDKYETTAREIQICRFSTFCSKWRMTFRKVTPAALKVNVKKFWQVLLVPWHVWAPIWVHFAPWWSIFPVKNRFSHIFPVPGGLPFLTVILTVKLARLGKVVMTIFFDWNMIKKTMITFYNYIPPDSLSAAVSP